MAEKNGITELVFILDRSGSMSGLESDTIGGFNSVLNKQKQEPGTCYVTTVLFDHEMNMLHDRVDLQEVPLMTDKEYVTRGSTALLDAIGRTIDHIVSIYRYARPEDIPEHTMFVITTDGMENASREYTADRVRSMVQHEEEKYGWEFIFLGANIDAVQTAQHMGIRAERAVDYHADALGTAVLYESVNEAVHQMRRGSVQSSWKAAAKADFEARPRASNRTAPTTGNSTSGDANSTSPNSNPGASKSGFFHRFLR